MSRPHPWRRHAGALALPTLALAAGVVLGELAVWTAVLLEQLPLWAGAVLATLLAYVAFTPMHDASHGAVGGSPRRAWIDSLVGHLMGLPLLAPYAVFRCIHLRHHGATNHPVRDPDYWVNGQTAVGTAARCLTISAHYYWIAFSEMRRPGSAMRRVALPAVLGLLVQAALLGVLVALGLGLEVLALWVLPGVLASGLLAFLFDWLPHHPHSTRGRGVDTRLILIPGLAVPMLNQHLHLVHHLYPRVPFYRYGALYREISPDLGDAPVLGWAPRS
jgi:fatty acid desaturase